MHSCLKIFFFFFLNLLWTYYYVPDTVLSFLYIISICKNLSLK